MNANNMPDNLEKARIQIVYSEWFYGSILYGLPCVEAPNLATMGTDGKNIYYDPEWVKDKPVPALKGTLIHELWHVMNKHHLRLASMLRGKNEEQSAEIAQRWNVACDYVVNQLCLDDGFTLPDGALIDPQYRGMSAEQVYDKLPKEPKGQDGQASQPAGPKGQSWGEVLSEAQGMTDEEIKQASDEIETKIRQAAMVAKSRGNLPGSVEELLKEFDESKIDWKARLWRATDTHGAAWEDDTWDRPNRHYVQHGLYLPSVEEFGPGTVAIAVDTSGSVSDNEIKAFVGEMQGIAQTTKPEKIILIKCDTEIYDGPKVFEADDDIEVGNIRRGGTRFEPPFEWLEEQGIKPQYMVYLTDGEARFPKEPDFPVIWVISTKKQAPFGETIHIS